MMAPDVTVYVGLIDKTERMVDLHETLGKLGKLGKRAQDTRGCRRNFINGHRSIARE